MINQLEQMTVREIFKGNSEYCIPKYQREYMWRPETCYAFFRDIKDYEAGYCLGSFICINPCPSKSNRFEIVDGQQRLITLMLMFAALYVKLKNYENRMNHDDKKKFEDLRLMLAYHENNEYKQKMILQEQDRNNDDFSYILASNGMITGARTEPDGYQKRIIAQRFESLKWYIQETVIKDSNIREIDALFAAESKIEKAVLVRFVTDSVKSAYMLFNSLSINITSMSVIDLMRNLVVRCAGDNAEDCYKKWEEILSNIGLDDERKQELFLRHYYYAFGNKLNTSYGITEAKKRYRWPGLSSDSFYLDVFEGLIETNCEKLLNDLLEKSRYYAILKNNSETVFVYSQSLKELSASGGYLPSYILLLYLLAKQRELKITDEQIKEIIEALIPFCVSQQVTNRPPIRHLELFFTDIVEVLENQAGDDIVSIVKDQLEKRICSRKSV